MSMKLLGESFDIHTGGVDNIFPHHECEIAQNECAHDGQKSVNYWLHTGYLLVNGEKMSKSKGNFFTIRDLLNQGWKGHEIRYTLLSGHYRAPQNFTTDGLQAARSSIARITECIRILRENTTPETQPSDSAEAFRTKFKNAIFDDLNVSDALAAVFDLIGEVYQKRDIQSLSPEDAAAALDFLENDFDHIFEILPETQEISAEKRTYIEQKIQEREQYRAEKNWAQSDKIRDELLQEGIELVDEKGKTGWRVME
jgi:cysteinyl-tRNA synthetase